MMKTWVTGVKAVVAGLAVVGCPLSVFPTVKVTVLGPAITKELKSTRSWSWEQKLLANLLEDLLLKMSEIGHFDAFS